MDDICQSLQCPVDLIDTYDVIPDFRMGREIRSTGVILYEG